MIVKPNNKKEVILDDVRLKEEISKNDSIAIMLEQNDGTYKESNESMFPSNMVFNSEKSGCIDKEGKKIDNSLTYGNGLITINTNKTSYCYVYFDRKENGSLILSETSGTLNKGSTHTFTVTNNLSGGALSVVSNDNNIATASISGNTITITGVSEGSTTITVTSAETDNYLSSSVTYNVTVNGMLTVTVPSDLYGYSSSYTGTSASYVTPDGNSGSLNLAGVYELPPGTRITLTSWTDEKDAYIYVNDVCVENEKATSSKIEVQYSYTLNTNVAITSQYYGGPNIYLKEVPEGHVLVTITNSRSGSRGIPYVTIEGTIYEIAYSGSRCLVVPIGTEITYGFREVEDTYNHVTGTLEVYVNNALVSLPYSPYVVSGNTSILLRNSDSNLGGQGGHTYYNSYGYIYIYGE